MIALDTNALVRLLIEDDMDQALRVRRLVEAAEKKAEQVLILSEVLIETVWVLESVYECTRAEIHQFLQNLTLAEVFTFPNPDVISWAIKQYRKGGDFADLVIVKQAMSLRARVLFSFDKKLPKKFPTYVIDNP